MEEWGAANWALMIPIIAIVGGFTVAIVSTIMRSRLRELEIRERIAMIEKGLVPPPEVDPRGFERALARASTVQAGVSAGAARHRRAGITLMGVGFGLMVLIAFAGETPSAAIGVGGFLVILGLAFFVNHLFELRHQPTIPPPAGPSTPADRP